MAFGVHTNCSSIHRSKMEFFGFFDILTIHNDEYILCKPCFRPSLCVFHPVWVFFLWGGGRGGKGAGAQPACALFQPPKLILLFSDHPK